MTEDEARDKWCPQTFNVGQGEQSCTCRASDCAVWVWDGGELSQNKLHDTRFGHCGLIR